MALLTSLAKNAWSSVVSLACLLVLTAHVAAYFRGSLPLPPGRNADSFDEIETSTLGTAESLFALSSYPAVVPATNRTHLFYTEYFQPPAPPPAPPAPPAPLQKVEFVYQGFVETAEGEKQAFVKAGDRLLVARRGGKLIGDFSIAEISLRSLTVTNARAQTNVLEFRTGKELTLPPP